MTQRAAPSRAARSAPWRYNDAHLVIVGLSRISTDLGSGHGLGGAEDSDAHGRFRHLIHVSL